MLSVVLSEECFEHVQPKLEMLLASNNTQLQPFAVHEGSVSTLLTIVTGRGHTGTVSFPYRRNHHAHAHSLPDASRRYAGKLSCTCPPAALEGDMADRVPPNIDAVGTESRWPSNELTQVELTWIEKKIEHWIRFGDFVAEKRLDRRRRIVSFSPNTVFAFVRWASNDFGTILSRIDIVRAVSAKETYQTLPFIRPGGEILLRMESWPKVERALQAIDVIEALHIDPAEVAPEHWRHIHNRLTAGREFHAYSREQHEAWLQRRRITS